MDMSERFNHIVLSLLLLVGTTGLTLSAHYCGGELYSFKIFGGASDCCADTDCSTCSDNSFIFGFSDEYIVSNSQIKFYSFTFYKVHFIGFLAGSNSYHNSNNRQSIIHYKTQPPGLKQSLSIMQSYLL